MGFGSSGFVAAMPPGHLGYAGSLGCAQEAFPLLDWDSTMDSVGGQGGCCHQAMDVPRFFLPVRR